VNLVGLEIEIECTCPRCGEVFCQIKEIDPPERDELGDLWAGSMK